MIRVRFAPSPTGYLHIGSLRTFFFNWLFARKNKGKLILRIEDTDQKRYVEGAIENMLETLEKIGLDWDEGPKRVIKKKGKSQIIKIIEKGKYGPYFQSKRILLYQNLAQKMVENGWAYYCFCSEKILEEMRKEQIAKKLPPRYDRRCRYLTEDEIKRNFKKGLPYVIRLKVPEEGKIKFKDIIYGEIEFDLKNIDDQVLLKSDGWPTYHLANVVDDHLMKITHVIRGEEWLPSVPKHLLIYKAFNWEPPKFAHVPLILNEDRSKLSKRQGDVAVEDYLAKGYLKEAILNFIVLLGWNPDSDQEIFTLKELIRQFSLEKIQKTGAVFNRQKLDWLNGYYIRKMKIKELTEKCIPYLIAAGLIEKVSKFLYKIKQTKEIIDFKKLKKIVALEKERLVRLDEIGEKTKFFFVDKLEYNPQILIWKKSDLNKTRECLNLVKDHLSKLSPNKFTLKNIQEVLNKLAKIKGTGDIFWPFRVALTGLEGSPPPAEIAEILGKEKTLKRVEEALKKLC
jgi:glutamyl-tRNA synthetase